MTYKRLSRTLFVAAMLLLAGCEKPNAVELVSADRQLGDLEVIHDVSPAFPVLDLELDALPTSVRSTEILPITEQQGGGQLIIVGVQYDDSSGHRETSIARAIFIDGSTPVVVNGDTAGYRAFDAGDVRLNDLLLYREAHLLRLGEGTSDTLAGVQYTLLSRDGVGFRGFVFDGDRLYRWRGFGSSEFPSFTLSIPSPTAIHVTSPAPTGVVSASQNLPVYWQGGGTSINIYISAYKEGQRPKVIFQMRSRSNRGGAIIPATVLELLPKDYSKFLFTFSSESVSSTRISGYSEEILMQAVTSHTLLLRLER